MNIGYIGLGAMGGAIAARLLGAHQLTVWDVNTDACAALRELGAQVAPFAAELARRCDVVLLCLPRSSDVAELLFGPAGLAEGLSPGKLVIDQTSGLPGETRDIGVRLAALGVDLVEAPVSGGVPAAVAGTITIMVCGPAHSRERAQPVLRALSPNILRCGDRAGDAQAMKLVNNVLNAGYRVATLEAVALGRKLGLSLAAITAALNEGESRNSTSLRVLAPLAEGKPFPFRATIALLLKDIDQAIQLGMECGAPTLLANLVRGVLQAGVNARGEDAQVEELTEFVGAMAGTRIVDLAAGTHGPAGSHEAVAVRNAVSACNELLTYEAAALAARYGLEPGAFATVINQSSGCSGTTERILPALAQGELSSGVSLQVKVEELQAVARLARKHGAPMLVGNAVCNLFEMGLHVLGHAADAAAMAGWYESTSGTNFKGA